ncbi:hypothetical protein [Streptomyces xantholiticus]|uniref:Integrase n=1 Tax=Streptomyces xantholiticus TaxID=68285 RepID=A0ABV1V3Z4_9ACTN
MLRFPPRPYCRTPGTGGARRRRGGVRRGPRDLPGPLLAGLEGSRRPRRRPAFRPIDQWGHLSDRRLSPDGCPQAQTRAAERAGLSSRITGHSYRSGLITIGRKKGNGVEKLRARSGRAENSPVFWKYVRDGEKWEHAATDGIGL